MINTDSRTAPIANEHVSIMEMPSRATPPNSVIPMAVGFFSDFSCPSAPVSSIDFGMMETLPSALRFHSIQNSTQGGATSRCSLPLRRGHVVGAGKPVSEIDRPTDAAAACGRAGSARYHPVKPDRLGKLGSRAERPKPSSASQVPVGTTRSDQPWHNRPPDGADATRLRQVHICVDPLPGLVVHTASRQLCYRHLAHEEPCRTLRPSGARHGERARITTRIQSAPRPAGCRLLANLPQG
jgi:hypothetical protein